MSVITNKDSKDHDGVLRVRDGRELRVHLRNFFFNLSLIIKRQNFSLKFHLDSNFVWPPPIVIIPKSSTSDAMNSLTKFNRTNRIQYEFESCDSKTSESPRRGLDRKPNRPRNKRSREPNQGHHDLGRDLIEYNTKS